MATLSYNSLLPYIALDTQGASEPLMVAMINFSVRELCLQSGCWNKHEDIAIVSGQSDYSPTVPTGAKVRYVRSILLNNNREITPASEDHLLYYKRDAFAAIGSPLYFYMLDDGKFRLLPKPADNDSGLVMNVRTVFVPEFEATVFDSDLLEKYAETIVSGAKAKLMEMPAKAWSNPNLAAYHKQVFNDGVSKARIDVELSNVGSIMKVKARNFKGV